MLLQEDKVHSIRDYLLVSSSLCCENHKTVHLHRVFFFCGKIRYCYRTKYNENHKILLLEAIENGELRTLHENEMARIVKMIEIGLILSVMAPDSNSEREDALDKFPIPNLEIE